MCLLDRGLPVLGGSHHDNTVLVVEERPQSVEHERLIIDNEDGDVCHVTGYYLLITIHGGEPGIS
ncbi:hypothetical protein SK1NUM_02510 [Arachnia rubra]|nr:hypothetical protein SK1NUM_02510 [Arachnia rubra]